jgi:regulatory protein
MFEEDAYQKLIEGALHFVSIRPRSEKELKEFLIKKANRQKTNLSVTDAVMARLRELGYADDKVFASWWFTARTHTKPKGRRLIEYELIRKGVPPKIIREVINDETPDTDTNSEKSELSLAKSAISKKLHLWNSLPILQKKRKIYSFLTRRGFSSEIIGSVVDDVTGKDYNTSQI